MENGASDRHASAILKELSELYSGSVTDPRLIRELLSSVVARQGSFSGRRTLRGFGETLRPQGVEDERILAYAEHIEVERDRILILGFDAGGRSYSFTTRVTRVAQRGPSEFEIPSVIYLRDRRDCPRQWCGALDARTARVELENGTHFAAQIRDLSANGIALQCVAEPVPKRLDSLRTVYCDDAGATYTRWAQVKHVEPVEGQAGWVRLGLATSEVPFSTPIAVDRRKNILGRDGRGAIRTRATTVALGARIAANRVSSRLGREAELPQLEVVDFAARNGERIRGIVDRSGGSDNTIGVVIPPAWGRTKETLLPLARTICEAFRRADESVVVLRFDGIRRRGESHNDPECRKSGREHYNFTLSQAVSDIGAAERFLREESSIGARQVALVTFSAASIEGRRAAQKSSESNVDAWISVVGAPDLQSGMRTVSGGIDYFGGAERGLRFGTQEIMGVAADIDKLAADALEQRLVFLEDARRDMSDVDIPVTWIHGFHDAWLDLERVREIMGCGNRSKRRLLAVPTGHQLQSSREALEVFQLVALELLRFRGGDGRSLGAPDPVDLERRRLAERTRLAVHTVDLPSFWKDYLVGRDGAIGIELMNATTAYRKMMAAQVDGLALNEGDVVADLGAGTGPFAEDVARSNKLKDLTIDMYDYVREGLDRAKERMAKHQSPGLGLSFFVQDLDAKDLADRIGRKRYDAVLASLVLSYVKDPEALLRQMFQILKPAGRIVVSTLRRDADVSKLYLEGIEELKSGRGREEFGPLGEQRLSTSAQLFLNDAARVLDLQESGEFSFWDSAELEAMVISAGFSDASVRAEFGVPPQAFVVRARRP